jgi:hypothetical protein
MASLAAGYPTTSRVMRNAMADPNEQDLGNTKGPSASDPVLESAAPAPVARKPYVPPSLKVHGSLQELTLSGGGSFGFP